MTNRRTNKEELQQWDRLRTANRKRKLVGGDRLRTGSTRTKPHP